MRNLLTAFALATIASTSGCQCFQQIEQWKCDNWGMCHFAQQRPGVYSPMVLPPTYGVPPTGLAPAPTYNPVYPAAGMVPPGPPGANAYPAPTANPYGGTVIPNGNCRECQK